MPRIWLFFCLAVSASLLPQLGLADGVNEGLADPTVIAAPRANPLAAPLAVPHVLPGSNQVGRPGIPADQLGGYEVNLAYDHMVVGAAVVGVLFLMTEWMENR